MTIWRARIWLLDTHAVEWWHDGERSHWRVTPFPKDSDGQD